MSGFTVEEISLGEHDFSFEIDGPEAADLGAQLLSRLTEMNESQFKEFIEKTGDLDA